MTQPVEPTDPCDHEWEFQDDSFSHEFGTEVVHYFQCAICGKQRDVEPGDYYEDDVYDFDYPDSPI